MPREFKPGDVVYVARNTGRHSRWTRTIVVLGSGQPAINKGEGPSKFWIGATTNREVRVMAYGAYWYQRDKRRIHFPALVNTQCFPNARNRIIPESEYEETIARQAAARAEREAEAEAARAESIRIANENEIYNAGLLLTEIIAALDPPDGKGAAWLYQEKRDSAIQVIRDFPGVRVTAHRKVDNINE